VDEVTSKALLEHLYRLQEENFIKKGPDGLHVLTDRGRYQREIEEAQNRLTVLMRLAGRPGLDPLHRSRNRTRRP